MEIQLKQAVLHVLDTNIDCPVLSDETMPLPPDIEEFLLAHIERAFQSDDAKEGKLPLSVPFSRYVQEYAENFLTASQGIANEIFALMKQNDPIPNADLVVVDAVLDGEPSLVLLKLNYKDSFIHYFENMGGARSNSIIHQRTALPFPASKVDEAVFVGALSQSVRLVEKKYTIDGKKDFYLSNCLLQCELGASEKQKLAAVKKAVEAVNERFYDNGREIETHVASVLCGHAEDDVTIEDLCESFYGDSPAVKQEFETALQENHLDLSDKVSISQAAARRMEKQSLKTESGVEIKIPIQAYQRGDALEFINNPDGTISLLIRNVIV